MCPWEKLGSDADRDILRENLMGQHECRWGVDKRTNRMSWRSWANRKQSPVQHVPVSRQDGWTWLLPVKPLLTGWLSWAQRDLLLLNRRPKVIKSSGITVDATRFKRYLSVLLQRLEKQLSDKTPAAYSEVLPLSKYIITQVWLGSGASKLCRLKFTQNSKWMRLCRMSLTVLHPLCICTL